MELFRNKNMWLKSGIANKKREVKNIENNTMLSGTQIKHVQLQCMDGRILTIIGHMLHKFGWKNLIQICEKYLEQFWWKEFDRIRAYS